MRIPLCLLIATGMILFLATPRDSFAQETQPSADASTEPNEPAKAKPAPVTAPEPEEAPMPPLPAMEEGQLDPLPPPSDGPAPVPPGFREVTMNEASAAKPPLNVLDLHGYLRMRGDISNGLDLGLAKYPVTYPGADDRGVAYPQFPGSNSGRSDTLSSANLRFRLEPTINISEDVRIMGQIDILDNLVMGSTPDGYPANAYYPLVAFSQGQIPPTAGFNSTRNSIAVKRLWGEVMTPLGLLRFGRMPSHWGLGLLANDGGPAHYDAGPLVTRPDPLGQVGQCFDCDYGSTSDRILFATKLFGHYFVPMIDFTAEGPYFTQVNEYNGQPVDLDQLDDVNSYILAVFKRDKPEDIRHALEQDEYVFNYGAQLVYRNQALDAADYHSQQVGDPNSGATQSIGNYAVRNAEAFIPDFWMRFMWGKLRIEMEAVMVWGKIDHTNIGSNLDADGNLEPHAEEQLDMLQFGGVLQADYRVMNDQLILGLELGFASGDNSPGMGVRPFEEKQFSHTHGDHDVNNFRFNLDYHVDLILWRQIIGTVTDAMYFKPSLQYNIAEGLGAKISAIYSSAIYAASTRGKSSPLGLEFDVDFFYFSDDNFHAGVSYGMLIPFAGMQYLGEDMETGGIGDFNLDDDGDVAHRIMARLVLYF